MNANLLLLTDTNFIPTGICVHVGDKLNILSDEILVVAKSEPFESITTKSFLSVSAHCNIFVPGKFIFNQTYDIYYNIL